MDPKQIIFFFFWGGGGGGCGIEEKLGHEKKLL